MNTVVKNHNVNGNLYSFPLPVECPHCSTICDPIINGTAHYGDTWLLVLSANCCKNPFYAVYKVSQTNGVLLTVYPSSKSRTFSERISNLSPRFVSFYNQAYAAEQLGHLDLAGCGYRSALEILIKDFAISKGEKEEKVNNLSLRNAINNYYPYPELNGLPHAIRLLGNDYTHYKQEYTEVEFSTFKQYLEGAIQFIELHLMARNLPQKDTEA